MPTFLALVGMFISVMLIGIILLQRGRGGGLVGALSGLGGQSAFGTKAGDTFTRITIGIAAAWVLLAGIHGQVLRARTEKFKNEATAPEVTSSPKEKGGGSIKSDDSKEESGLGSSTGASQKKGEKVKEEDSKSNESTKEITPEDNKKSDSAPKSNEPPKKELEESTDAKPDEKSDEKK